MSRVQGKGLGVDLSPAHAARGQRIGWRVLIAGVAVLALSVALGAAQPAHGAEGILSGLATVTDGDTIKIGGIPVRLAGIDAVEHDQTSTANGVEWDCGVQSTLALVQKIHAGEVFCEVKGQDKYRRALGICWLVGGGSTEVAGSLNAQMVHDGWAMAYRKFTPIYEPTEDEAKAAHRGIWRGTFVEPETFRHAQRITISEVTQ